MSHSLELELRLSRLEIIQLQKQLRRYEKEREFAVRILEERHNATVQDIKKDLDRVRHDVQREKEEHQRLLSRVQEDVQIANQQRTNDARIAAEEKTHLLQKIRDQDEHIDVLKTTLRDLPSLLTQKRVVEDSRPELLAEPASPIALIESPTESKAQSRIPSSRVKKLAVEEPSPRKSIYSTVLIRSTGSSPEQVETTAVPSIKPNIFMTNQSDLRVPTLDAEHFPPLSTPKPTQKTESTGSEPAAVTTETPKSYATASSLLRSQPTAPPGKSQPMTREEAEALIPRSTGYTAENMAQLAAITAELAKKHNVPNDGNMDIMTLITKVTENSEYQEKKSHDPTSEKRNTLWRKKNDPKQGGPRLQPPEKAKIPFYAAGQELTSIIQSQSKYSENKGSGGRSILTPMPIHASYQAAPEVAHFPRHILFPNAPWIESPASAQLVKDREAGVGEKIVPSKKRKLEERDQFEEDGIEIPRQMAALRMNNIQ